MEKLIFFILLFITSAANAQVNDTLSTPKADETLTESIGDTLIWRWIPEPMVPINFIETLYEAGGVAGSGDYAPMWHFANRQGTGSHKSNWVYARVGTAGRKLFNNNKIELRWGLDIIGGYNLTSNIFVQQAYIDLDWKRIRLSIGQKERWSEFGNHRLTSGALIESGNARPIPQIRFELPHYWNIPGTGHWVGIKGHIAYGMFTDGGWQKDFVDEGNAYASGACYHSKAGFIRFGNESECKLSAEIGLQMVSQFGGTIYNRFNKPVIYAPTRLKDYLLALIPLKGDEQYVAADQANVAGNVLGSWMGAITWREPRSGWEAQLYYDHVFEDHSQMFWEYGLWTEQLVGIQLKTDRFKWVKGVTLEYFNLKKHSGPIYHDSTNEIPDQISCKDNNYWHHTYGGWFNYGMMTGTPFVTSPIYNKDGTLGIYNNRVEAFHFGIEGEPLKWLGYRLLFTKSNNWGTYSVPFTKMKTNHSGLIELTFIPAQRWSVKASFAFDNGKLYGNNYGGMITITRRNLFRL